MTMNIVNTKSLMPENADIRLGNGYYIKVRNGRIVNGNEAYLSLLNWFGESILKKIISTNHRAAVDDLDFQKMLAYEHYAYLQVATMMRAMISRFHKIKETSVFGEFNIDVLEEFLRITVLTSRLSDGQFDMRSFK